MLSIKEVARLTGLSTATVSRALDPRYADKVKPENRKKILEICDSGNYRPGIAGRSFVTGKSYKIGFISGEGAKDFGNLFFGYFLQGASMALQKAGYNFLLLCTSDETEKSDCVVDFLRSGVADAYIMGQGLFTESVQRTVKECQVPVLRLRGDFLSPYGTSLSIDIRPAYQEIWRRFPEELKSEAVFCCRHRLEEKFKIASELAPEGISLPFVELPTSINFAEVRFQAAREAEKKFDILRQYKVLWCSSDLMALGIKDVFDRAGLTVGKDYYLIGYDNIEGLPSNTDSPLLSTVDGAWEEFGILAAQMVLEALDNKILTPRKFTLKFIRRISFPF